MGLPELNPQEFIPVNINWSDRWRIHYRLQELGISSDCPVNCSFLRVLVDCPFALLQLWSVLKQYAWSRPEQVHWLERCWQIQCDQPIENQY